MFEFFEHTADIGIRVIARDLNSLFEEAGRALFSLIVREPGSIRPSKTSDFELSESDCALLLRDWLNELLFQFECRKMLFAQFDVRIVEDKLTARARGESFDAKRHELEHEIKAITYHGLKVQQTDDRWLAEVILDI